MKLRPRPSFVAMVLDAIPDDGTPVSARGVFIAIGSKSTPAYVRTVLRQLHRTGQIVGVGHPSVRVYRRIPDSTSVDRVPAGGQPAVSEGHAL
jgi:hypothetical protein